MKKILICGASPVSAAYKQTLRMLLEVPVHRCNELPDKVPTARVILLTDPSQTGIELRKIIFSTTDQLRTTLGWEGHLVVLTPYIEALRQVKTLSLTGEKDDTRHTFDGIPGHDVFTSTEALVGVIKIIENPTFVAREAWQSQIVRRSLLASVRASIESGRTSLRDGNHDGASLHASNALDTTAKIDLVGVTETHEAHNSVQDILLMYKGKQELSRTSCQDIFTTLKKALS